MRKLKPQERQHKSLRKLMPRAQLAESRRPRQQAGPKLPQLMPRAQLAEGCRLRPLIQLAEGRKRAEPLLIQLAESCKPMPSLRSRRSLWSLKPPQSH